MVEDTFFELLSQCAKPNDNKLLQRILVKKVKEKIAKNLRGRLLS